MNWWLGDFVFAKTPHVQPRKFLGSQAMNGLIDGSTASCNPFVPAFTLSHINTFTLWQRAWHIQWQWQPMKLWQSFSPSSSHPWSRFYLASLPGFRMQSFVSLHWAHGHDRQPNYQSRHTASWARRPVTQCLLPWPHCSYVSSHLVINFWPLECFAMYMFCFMHIFCFLWQQRNVCISKYKSVQPLSVRPPSTRSLVACPAEIHACQSLSVQVHSTSSTLSLSHISHLTACQININSDDWIEQPEMLQHRKTCLDHAIQWVNGSNRRSYS